MQRFWYFDVSFWSVVKKPYHSGLCQNSVFTLYCKDWEPICPPNLFKRLQFPWIPLRYPQTPLRVLPDTPRYPQGKWNANRQQQMPRNIARLSQTAPVSFLGSLAVSVGVCWHVMFRRDAMGLSGECLGVSGGIWVEFMEILGAQMCLGGIWVLNPCSMEWKHIYCSVLKGTIFCQLTIMRHQNTKTAAYKLSKNDWVMPFFVIFRFAREKLLVTVSLDHPVSKHQSKLPFNSIEYQVSYRQSKHLNI